MRVWMLLISLLWPAMGHAAMYWDESFESPCGACNWTDYNLGHTGLSPVGSQAYRGTQALEMRYPNGGFLDRFMAMKHDQFNIRFAIKLGSTWQTNANNSKIIYIRNDQSVTPNVNGVLEMVWGGRGLVVAIQGAADRTDTEVLKLNIDLTDSWQEIEFQWMLNTPCQANGSMAAWLLKNGTWTQTFSQGGRQYRGCTPAQGSGTYIDNIRLYAQGGTGSLYLDHIATGNSRIGTGATVTPPPVTPPVTPPPVTPPVIPSTKLPSPDILLPVVGATIPSGVTEFRWTPVVGAAQYILNVHEEGQSYDCNLMLFCGNLSATSKTLTLKPGKKYDWWVLGVDGQAKPGESRGSAFTTQGVIVTPPVTPPPVTPPPVTPPSGPAFSNIQNKDDELSFTFDETRCPKGTRRFIKGRDRKTITITCER
jgi:hypothetical protein